MKKKIVALCKSFAKIKYSGSVDRFSETTGFGNHSLCLVSPDYGKLFTEELEAARKAIRRNIKKRGGILQLHVHSRFTYTKKPLQARMGKGKGRIQGTFSFVRPGQIIFEVRGAPLAKATAALESGSKKLSLRTLVRPFGALFG